MMSYVPNSVQITSRREEFDWRDRVTTWRTHWHADMATGQDFTQSVWVEGTRDSSRNKHTRMTESVNVLPSRSGNYQVYIPHSGTYDVYNPPAGTYDVYKPQSGGYVNGHHAAEYKKRQDKHQNNSRQDLTQSVQLASSNYRHNIRNPEMRKKQQERIRKYESQSLTKSAVYCNPRKLDIPEGYSFHDSYAGCEGSFTCSCKQYHSHQFNFSPVNTAILNQAEKREQLLSSYDESTLQSDTYDDPRNIFWSPALSFHSYRLGDPVVSFSSLWPRETELKNHLKNCGLQLVLIRGAVLDLCKLSVTCGPIRLLKCLIDLSLVRVDQQLDNGSGMLHLACLSRNTEAMQYLINANISPKITDRNGFTADQVCFCAQVKKQLPQRYLLHKETHSESQLVMNPSLQDKDTIFSLARNPKFFDEIQKKLQTFDFNVNVECDSNGDFLLHIAAKGGLSHLPLIMALMNIQKADVELCNADGMTSLMLVAAAGNCVLCDKWDLTTMNEVQNTWLEAMRTTPVVPRAVEFNDYVVTTWVDDDARFALRMWNHFTSAGPRTNNNLEGFHSRVLMCLFGANPNKQNQTNGCSALHYAVDGNHRKTVECLVRRGADVNIEDHDGRRPDDIPSCTGSQDDCKEVISFNRMKRLEHLSEQVRKGAVELSTLLPTDMCVTDDDGYTLVMIAAIYDQVVTLTHLLTINSATINAQHTKTGMTALGIASQMGNDGIVAILLDHGANPSIADMEGYLPLHHAILNNQEMVLDCFLEFFPSTYIGLYKAERLCKKSSIHIKLKQAWERRQEEIVTPKLLDCCLNGNASELYCMLEDGDSINMRSGSGNWPLYLAVENGNLDVVKLLFEKGGDIRKRHSTTGATVLHLASKMGHSQIVEFLIMFCRSSGEITKMKQKGQSCRRMLDINVVDAENKTALQLAAEKGFIKIVRLLLGCGGTTAILDTKGSLFTCPEFEGVRITIDAQRDQQTKLIMKCVTDKSKKAFVTLQNSWLPRFDHNLRTKEGDTPLMLACRCGRLPVVKFLLESAVYPEVLEEEDGVDDSDADSGVLDPSGVLIKNHLRSTGEDEFQTSFSQSVEVDELTHSVEVRPSDQSTLPVPSRFDGTLQTLLKDVSRPKGRSIYQNSYISHISAVNLFDGCTPLHRTIEGGDNPMVVRALLKLDMFCLNTQNDAGISALHLACRLGRKKIVDVLLTYEEIDLNSRTLDGLLPEEMTTTKSIIKKLQQARRNHTMYFPSPVSTEALISTSDSVCASITGTTVNFDRVHSRYEALKQQVKQENKS